MTAIDTQTRFDRAIENAIQEATVSANLRVLKVAAMRGFAAAGAILNAVATEAMRQKDRTALAILTRLGHPGALESLNLAERLQGKAQTPAPAQAFEGWREAEAEFEKLASRHFIGDAFGQQKFIAAQAFKHELAAHEQRKAEPATGITKAWPI